MSPTLHSRQCMPHAPVFPPLPYDDLCDPPPPPIQERERAPLLHCVPSLRGGGLRLAAGDISVGHGPGAPGNEGTAADRGTAAPGSNLTPQAPQDADAPPMRKQKKEEENEKKPPDDVLDEHDDEGLPEGGRHGPAQPAG